MLEAKVKKLRHRIDQYKYDVRTKEGKAFEAAVKRRKRAIYDLEAGVKSMKRCFKINPANHKPKHLEIALKALKLKMDKDTSTAYW